MKFVDAKKLHAKREITMKKKFGFNVVLLSVMAGVVGLTGCSTAKKSGDIAAVKSPVAPYLRMTCDELYTEQRVLTERLDSTRKAVDKAYSSDKTTEVVTWVLFAPAAFLLEGNQKEATEFSATKGQCEAVADAIDIKKCSSEMKAHEGNDDKKVQGDVEDKTAGVQKENNKAKL